MTTHASTLYIFGNEHRIAEASADGFLDTYGKSFVEAFTALYLTYGEDWMRQQLDNSIQLSISTDEKLENYQGIQRILDLPKNYSINQNLVADFIKSANEFPLQSFKLESDDMDAREAYMDALDAYVEHLLRNKWAHNFALQIMSGVFFKIYNPGPIEQYGTEALDRSDYFELVVNFNTRQVHVNFYGDEAVKTYGFDEVYAGKVDLTD